MFQNMGLYDRIIRVVVGLVLGGLYLSGVVEGTTALVLLIIGLVMIATSAIGFCPAYLPFKITTKEK
ncbi:DUF2892 domain-containing protein [Leptospira sp. 2 VSF19]|uniref:DUF2892 domain-containing protein n=1 Tax=Leptospira soteropolitanensis TaxID=2950025 RepID=A0AAW5VKG6_9LEPT|nr:DUF2892 domain-containing protein [Leptospira soteropolitanensis]MCW7491529.1 DUF2892 domain-containing protein [Leptospira soteropolitanensis]MCW7499113.1 DUF2892 domain-containing protein [Leptospira soteropolitanensis]MCW7521295.1 DUF2892 domain-containing protein [Leptospira soteropolitanensis]MCW7525217.1 DUF2892 domain-containing protein [Leptospira soteropolitanensis]MCW7529084.1 DUF2892 domain-containing protein [Leptospira soteropolitanensis]